MQNVPLNISLKPPRLAPIAEQEGGELDHVICAPSSSAIDQQPIDIARRSHPRGMPRMIRLRRKRREDPFGTLIQSTKKMRLNDPWNPVDEQKMAIDNGMGPISSRMLPSQAQNVAEMDGVLFAEDEEDELLFYYGGQDEGEDSDADGYDDDSDSNAEDYYKNDYPDEEGTKFISFADGVCKNEYENDSTSGDDNFDHYGDEKTNYRNYCYEAEDEDEEASIFGKMISARKNEDSD